MSTDTPGEGLTPPASQIFNRTMRLTGPDGFDALGRMRVIIFGVGGVGSWTAEALARSGVGTITVVDPDVVAVSNINRQLPALLSTVGEPKVEVMARRLLDINPRLSITPLRQRYCPETAQSFDLDSYDYVVDAIDSVADKALLIISATACRHARLVSSMGAALKADPARITTGWFEQVHGCRLAAALRRRFKHTDCWPRRRFKCVYSPELLPNRPTPDDLSGAMDYGKRAVNGALMHITAIFGLTLASLILTPMLKDR